MNKRKPSKEPASFKVSELEVTRLGIGLLFVIVGGFLLFFGHGWLAQLGAVIGVIGLAIAAFVINRGYI